MPLFQAHWGFHIAGEGPQGRGFFGAGVARGGTLPFEDHFVEVVEAVAGSIEGSGVKFQADDSKNDDGKKQEKGDVDQRTNGFAYGAHHHL